MERRNFLKTLGATAVSVGAAATIGTPTKSLAKSKQDIGECKSLKVTVLTETSWFDNVKFKKDIVDNGGASTSQYQVPWDPDNAGGYATLLEIEQLDGTVNKLLLDTGWSNEWMDYVYKRHGVDKMIESGEIDTMVISHWHLDHFWGIESTLKHNDKIKIYGPQTMFPEDEKLLAGGTLEAKGVQICKNDIPHKGELVKTNPKEWYNLYPGVALKEFDVPILLRVRGENVIYVNIKDKGIVTVTGCCHPGLLTLYSTARRQIKGGQNIYGCYGGLHISLFENWDPKFDDIIKGAKAFKPKKMGCNHCTGWIWAENAAKAGLPIIKGTDTYKTYPKQSSVAKASNVFLTNGDTVIFQIKHGTMHSTCIVPYSQIQYSGGFIMTTTSKNIYLSGLIAFIVMIIVNFALWRLFFAPTNGVFKLFTPMYGLSLVGLSFYVVMLTTDIFGYKNDSNNMGRAVTLLVSSIIIFYLLYYVFFWNILGKFGITYFSPQAQVAAGGTGMEMWNARENSSLAILYIVTTLIWVSTIWNAGFGKTPWEDLPQRDIGISKFFATAFLSVIIYSIFFHPNVTALFVPKQIYAGVVPWWESAALTASSFYHLGWMFGGLFIIIFLYDCAEGFPFNFISQKKSGSIWGFLVALIIAVGGGFLFLYIAEAIMTYFWYEPFTGGNYTDDPRFRHLHVAEISAFFILAMVIIKVFFNNIIQGSNKWVNALVRFIIIPCAGMLLYWFYYCETLGPKFVDRVPGVGSIEDTSLCWTFMSITLIMVYDKFFNAFPLRK